MLKIMQSLFVVFVVLFTIYGHGDNIKGGCYYGDDGTDICWSGKNVKNYPTRQINEEISKYPAESRIFGQTNSTVQNTPERYCNLCNSYSRPHLPLLIQHEGRQYFVVNTDKYRQQIYMQICARSQSDSICNASKEDLPYGHTPTCKQKFTMIRLLSYDPITARFSGQQVQYPSSCTCVLERNMFD